MPKAAGPLRQEGSGGAEPLPPPKKWLAITLATLVVVPAYWSILAAFVSSAGTAGTPGPGAGPLLAFGLALVPFAFLVLALLSGHPRPGGAVGRAMLLAILIGGPISALASDAVTGFVAGMGAGGISALRAEAAHSWKARAMAVLLATVGTFVILRTAGEAGLLLAPVLPFTSIGVVDHLREDRVGRGRRAAEGRAR